MANLVELDRTPPAPERGAITDEEARAMARATVNLFRAWELTDEQARILLGDLSPRTWARWKAGEIGRIERDRKTRLAVLMGIHKGLRHLFTESRRGYRWVKRANAAFGGQSALEVMLRGEITDLIRVRAYLDAERGGW